VLHLLTLTSLPLPAAPTDSSNCFGLTATPPVARIGPAAGPRAHVLVCAPSNSALDEIVLRVMKLVGRDGGGTGLMWCGLGEAGGAGRG
jgi:hypothetical protein